jgi:uncharacterized protein (DUF433 family)
MIDWAQCPHVESTPEKMAGAWVFKGTRLPISALFENLAAGASVRDFIKWFPGVDQEDVIAVLKFLVDHSRRPADLEAPMPQCEDNFRPLRPCTAQALSTVS